MYSAKISVKILPDGFSVFLERQHFTQKYPRKIWSSFPQHLKQNLAETAAVFFSLHYIFLDKLSLKYEFPPPPSLSLFFQGLLFSLPETVIETPKFKHKTSELIKVLFNGFQKIYFSSAPGKYIPVKPVASENSALIPFTFGKDSLLTLGLIKELGITPHLFFSEEPYSPFENKVRRKLLPDFKKETDIDAFLWPITIGKMRQKEDQMWGWDMLQFQYTLLFLPFLNYFKDSYILFSNEQNANYYEIDREGFYSNTYFEQSGNWMLQANNLIRSFSNNAKLGSIVEPLFELPIFYALHNRYPELGKFQVSCLGDSIQSKDSRWCCECLECERTYMFMLAIGLKPDKFGIRGNLLKSKSKNLFKIFDYQNRKSKSEAEFIKYYFEWFMVFYLSYKRGVRGGYMDKFINLYLKTTAKNIDSLFEKYVKVFPGISVPDDLKVSLNKIYEEEIKNLKKEIRKLS